MASHAVVARTKSNGLEYLARGDRPNWAPNPSDAALFDSLREATRAAMRLPSSARAFALPQA